MTLEPLYYVLMELAIKSTCVSWSIPVGIAGSPDNTGKSAGCEFTGWLGYSLTWTLQAKIYKLGTRFLVEPVWVDCPVVGLRMLWYVVSFELFFMVSYSSTPCRRWEVPLQVLARPLTKISVGGIIDLASYNYTSSPRCLQLGVLGTQY
jgi:hypothetical protein